MKGSAPLHASSKQSIKYTGPPRAVLAHTHLEISMSLPIEQLPQLRFEITEAARILRLSRATLYERIREGKLKTQKDGRRAFVSAAELQRYIAAMEKPS